MQTSAKSTEASAARRRVVGDVDDGRGLEAGADALVAALDLERAGDDAADAADAPPTWRRGAASCQSRGVAGKSTRWTELSSPGKRVEPDLLHGEGEHRGEPGDEAVEERVEHGAGGAAARAGRPRRSRARPCGRRSRRPRGRRSRTGRAPGRRAGSRRRRSPSRTSRSSSVRRCSTQRSSSGIVGGLDALGLVEAVEGAEEEAQGVAQAAVAVGGALEDLRADALVDGVVGLRHPEAEDVGAVLLDHVLRGRWCCPATSTSSCRSRRG